ncbi:TetR/AcrR family transcriptional regulator [Yersinia intermedia]|jgi:AcrR family transcriptional regulator|uniref:TetR family transcriptional regulator n=2 Tax=Yersinia intermedia TaxID=631 RepID=A0ABX6FEE6_YERIN|nr:TetR/AcrR family transcriptional regulator [Yersinia intermedia]MCB5300520.1 TetR/AcrR family transcriptional regulator [Yersinia intermedia]MCW8114052.1 TetR/AcrR family transcriptional regulator [Yersinia intermedia]MDA5482961.1 TetR/AcrR family transcriptional regulator [Yersinia intermedia]MDA5518540.1 TetR/AcrR family transcriptional regulator [Yersinia intermedia]OVZ75582.1 TetR family transcriptional regulator [Yersinia intermedia]
MSTSKKNVSSRLRLSREERYHQLMNTAWQLVREEGTEALTLGRLAERSGVTKPVVYDHFGTRAGLFAELYKEFDRRQTVLMDAAIAQCEPTLTAIATVTASSYIDCVLLQGQEISGVIAALKGTPELDEMKREYSKAYIHKCRNILAPYAKGNLISDASLWALLGAAEGLSCSAASGEITASQAKSELFELIVAIVERSMGQR